MGKIVWILVVPILLDIIISSLAGTPTYMHYFLGDTIGTTLLLILSVALIFWGIFRAIRGGGGGRTEGLIMIGVVLAANFLLGKAGYSDIYNTVMGPFWENPYVYGIIFLSFGGIPFIISIWKHSKGQSKQEKEKTQSKKGRISEARTRVWVKLLRRGKRYRLTASILNQLGKRYPSLPGELEFALKDLRIELYTLMNYLLRHEIYMAKTATTRNTAKKIQVMESPMIGELDEDSRHAELIRWIEGGEVLFLDSGGNPLQVITLGPNTYRPGDLGYPLPWNSRWELQANQHGIARKSIVIYKLMEQLKEALQTNLREPNQPKRLHETDYITDMKTTFIDKEMKELNTAYGAYGTAVKRFKIHNYVRAYRLYFQDMYNFHGQYVRGYCFAKLETPADPIKGTPAIPNIPELYEVGISKDYGVERLIDWGNQPGSTFTPTRIGTGAPAGYEPGTNFLEEVNIFGYSVRRINEIQIGMVAPDLPNGHFSIRKFKRDQIVWFHKKDLGRWAQILNLSVLDWDFVLKDMEKNQYHLYDRGISDYEQVINRGLVNYRRARFNRLLNPDQDIGFDMESLKNPGFFKYWGKQRYYDESPASPRMSPANPYPGVSITGLWDFITKVALKHSQNTNAIRMYMNNYFRLQYEFLPPITEEQGEAARK